MNKAKILHLVFFIILSYFTFYSIYGKRGYFAYLHHKRLLLETSEYLDISRSENLELSNNLELLKIHSLVENDLLDEYVRKVIGFVLENEYFFKVEQ